MKTEDIKNMARALQQVQEKKLSGNQHKLDMDKDGDIDAKDFAHMRKKKKSGKEEVTMNAKVDSEKGATEEQKEAKLDEISMDKARATFQARQKLKNRAGLAGDTATAQKHQDKARKTQDIIRKRNMANEATMDTAAGRKQAAADADAHHKAMVKKHGADHPATKDAAAAAKAMKAKANESTDWPVYKKIMENRAAHYKGATEPEAIDSKDSPGGKKMKADVMQGAKMDDTEEKGHDDVVAAGRVTKTAPGRNADNKAGDKTIVNPPEDITKKAGMKA
jgi:hypothetical protein